MLFELRNKKTKEMVPVYAFAKLKEKPHTAEFLIYDDDKEEFIWVPSAEYEPEDTYNDIF